MPGSTVSTIVCLFPFTGNARLSSSLCTSAAMRIDIWSDIICPFCYIGKRKLELALAQTGIEADIHWHSFELNPNAPQTYGMPLQGVLNALYGMGEQQALAVLNHEEQAAREVGLDFQWRIAKPGNTFNAHRLLHLARNMGLGLQAKERFLRAYFSEGQDIGDKAVLRALAIDVGLNPAEVDDVLDTDRFDRAVRADEQQAQQLGIQGVPYFLIDGEAVISGAREVEEFVRVLTLQQEKAKARTQAGAAEENAATQNGGNAAPDAGAGAGASSATHPAMPTPWPDDSPLMAEAADFFSGNRFPEGSLPLSQAYAGHQFGHFAMLGDGRATLIGEQITPDGQRIDIQLKGNGQTPYSRQGDGKAALGPMLREYLISEAMHALHIPTTRSLAVVTTGDRIHRRGPKTGAVLTRSAQSHIRVATFQYASPH